jgi:Skp family chaperone for outer membrane proteins
MTFRNRLAAIGAGLALAATLAGPALAAPKPLDASGVAYVDLAKVLAEYRKTTAFTKYQQKLRDQARDLREGMRLRAQLRYCTDAERNEVMAIKAKPKPTPAEQARMDALIKKADGIDNEMATLSQKTSPSAADTQRMQEISRMRTEAARGLAEAEGEMRDQLRKSEAGLMGEVESELLELVSKIAKDQKLNLIYERRAVLFGGTDLTTEVVKRLPK